MAEVLLPTLLMSQEQTEWCWAAITAALLETVAAQDLEQCEIVRNFRNQQGVCEAPEGHNYQAELDLVLPSFGLAVSTVRAGAITMPAIANSIVRRLPIAARIEDRTSFQGHAVLVVGCDVAEQAVVVSDPWNTPGTPAPRYRMPFVDFLNAYGGWGRCTHAFVL